MQQIKRPVRKPQPPCLRVSPWKIALIVVLFATALTVTVWPTSDAAPCQLPPTLEEELQMPSDDMEEEVSFDSLDERSEEPWSEEP